MSQFRIAVLLLVVGVLALRLLGAGERPRTQPVAAVSRSYDIRDLLVTAVDYVERDCW